MITNPTGKPIRVDAGGDGHYGASRRRSDGTRYAHKGTDFSGTPGQPVRVPIGGILKRKAKPYSKGEYSGC